jgi:hypothetical protein
VLGDVGGQARDRTRQVRRVRADDVGLETGEIDLDHLVEEALGIGLHFGVGAQ